MNELEIKENTFDSIKHIDEQGHEYWYARELMQILEYKRWEKFNNVIVVIYNLIFKYFKVPEIKKKRQHHNHNYFFLML